MYIPINIKTEYDLLNSLIRIDELISYAKDNNLLPQNGHSSGAKNIFSNTTFSPQGHTLQKAI